MFGFNSQFLQSRIISNSFNNFHDRLRSYQLIIICHGASTPSIIS